MTGVPSTAVAGKAVLHGKGKCTTCHSIGSDGGTLGPDLSDVGRRRNPQYLEESLVKPDADVSIPFRTFEITMRSGQSVTGIRLNEDDVSIQLRDRSGNLRSLLKENILEIRRDRPSMMPSYGASLAKRELENVVAYLSSLRGAQ